MKIKKLLKKYNHVWLLIYIPVYVVFFSFIEELITPASDYWISYTPIDDIIPFNEIFVIPYILWYPYILITGFFLFFTDKDAFIRYMLGFIIGFTTALIFYLILPNGQNLRPETFPRENFLTDIMASIYANDTNTNVLPSMHVIGSWVVFFGFLDSEKLHKKWLIIASCTLSVLISLSTVFCKQHSFLDVVWGLVWSAVIYVMLQVCLKKHMMKRRAKRENTKKDTKAIV